MKKAAAFAMAGSPMAHGLSLAVAHPDPARPDRVPASAWIPLTADVGYLLGTSP